MGMGFSMKGMDLTGCGKTNSFTNFKCFVTGHDFSRVSMGLRPTQVDENTNAGCPWFFAFGDQGMHEPTFASSFRVFDRTDKANQINVGLQPLQNHGSHFALKEPSFWSVFSRV